MLLIASSCSSVDSRASLQSARPLQIEPAINEPAVPDTEFDVPGEPAGDATAVPTEAPPDDRWDPALLELVSFVEESRGERFRIVPEVKFVDPDDLRAKLSAGVPSLDGLTPEAQRVASRIDDAYRALGVVQEDFAYLDSQRGVLGQATAYYDWQARSIVFPSVGGEVVDEISVADQPLMVHELGHALQAHSRHAWSANLTDPFVASAMIEGEAEWLLERYIAQLSDRDFALWLASLSDVPPEFSVPDVLAAEFLAPYLLGSRFFHVRFAIDGLDGVNGVFESHRVVARMLLDPWAYDGEQTFEQTFGYATPGQIGTGKSVNLGGDFPMSAVNWYVAFSAAMPGPQALTAARGITSLTLPSAWVSIDDRLCFAILLSTTEEALAILEQALIVWASVEGTKRWAHSLDDAFEVGGCDPGPGRVPVPRLDALSAIEAAALVIDSELWAFGQGLEPAMGFCIGWRYIAALESDPELYRSSFYESVDLAGLPVDC